jgi:endonuclease YncB( thermonuclease family)
MARYGRRKLWQTVVVLIAAAIVWFLDQRRGPQGGKGPTPTESRASTSSYETFTGCTFVEHKQNDGDSFRVKLPDGRVEQFRLYYVDTPESEFRTYRGGETNRKRIHEQAREFGISDEQAVEIGRKAKNLVHGFLSRRPFTVQTKWDDPFNDRRYHAFVTPASGPFLEETLVREGLVRIHTKPAALPDGTPVKVQLEKLHALEAEAKRAKRGAWGLATR